mgnify:FL=1
MAFLRLMVLVWYSSELLETNGRKGFTSFADLVTLNESQMYSGGKVKGAPKMYINLFAPDKANCMFLPDVFGPATAFGLSPYPPQVERDSNEPFADEEYKLWEAVKIDGKTKLTEDDLIKVYVAFLNMFSRENWKEKSPSGTGGIQFENPVTNVPWEFIFSGRIKRNQITRADLALLSFAELYSYKEGNEIDDRTYAEMAIDIINEGGRPKFNDLLDAPCFMPVPTVSSLIGYTEKPDPNAGEVYRHTGGGVFSVVDDGAVIEAGKTTAEYYAKYELDVSFLISAATAYKIKSYPEAEMDVTLKFGPEADGEDIFKHIHEEITGNPKVVVDPDEKFAKSVKGGIEFSESSSREGIRVEETLPEKIVVYIQHPDPGKTSTEENPITIASIKEDFSWEKAAFDISSLEKYSIDVFATVDIKVNGTVVQSVPGKNIRRQGDAEGAVHFKLPLYRDGGELNSKPHRVGYAMALDPRFAQSTYCLNEMREDGGIESFPYWVNNLMAEKYSEFNDLEDFEKSVEKPADLDLGNRLRPSFANPYSMLSMGFDANGEGEGGASSFWDNLLGLGDIETEFGKPYPDTLHKAPAGDISLVNDTGFDRNDFLMDWGVRGSGLNNLGELGMLAIGPWETISLYRTKTPEGKYDFHTVFDFFTMDTPTQLLPGKVNLNAPSLLMTQPKSPKRVKFAEGTSFANEGKLTIGDEKVSFADYVEATDGLNPEPLMAVLYGLGFDNYVAWEIASRVLYQNIDYSKNDNGGIYRFKDLSQLGYANSADKSILEYIMDEDNEQIFVQADFNPYSDSERESLIGKIAKHTTTRGQSFTIVIRSDAFAPKYGSDVDGTTLASKVAVVEAWRDTEPARDSEGNSLGYHNWHIRSVRIVD